MIFLNKILKVKKLAKSNIYSLCLFTYQYALYALHICPLKEMSKKLFFRFYEKGMVTDRGATRGDVWTACHPLLQYLSN